MFGIGDEFGTGMSSKPTGVAKAVPMNGNLRVALSRF